MVIDKGQDWGRPYAGDRPIVAAVGDADLADKVHRSLSRGDGADEILFTVGTGDVAASLGFGDPSDVDRSASDRLVFPMDLGLVEAGPKAGQPETTFPFAAHVVGRSNRWAWPELIVMNAPLAGELRFGPRAHLNDGVLDITTGRLPWRQARQARERARSGSHLPHPELTTVRRSEFEFTSSTALHIEVDGEPRGRWRWFRVTVVADAFELVLPLVG